MKKIVLTAFLLTSTLAVFSRDLSTYGRPRGCREWYVKIFGYTLLAHHSDACNNSDGNWDWGANGTNY